MAFYPDTDFGLETAKGNKSGHSLFHALGERDSIGNTSTGEDIWPGTAKKVPIPGQSSGETIKIVSDNANDTNSSGSGVRKVTIKWLDSSWAQQSNTYNMNGTTEVAGPTSCKFILSVSASEVGSNGAALGTITVYKDGASSTIYNQIEPGGNMCRTINRMVPAGYTFYCTGWSAGASGSSRVVVRLRASSLDGAYVGADGDNPVFLFKDTANLQDSSHVQIFSPPKKFPEKTYIKCSGWTNAPGAYVSAHFHGFLVQNPA